MYSHEGNRRENRCRGDDNLLVDCMGAFGELTLFNQTRELGLSEGEDYIREHIYMDADQLEETGDDPDMINGNWRWDVKTFDCSPHKEFFAINREKHTSLEDSCSNYFCVLAPPFAKQALLVLVPYSDVSEWPAWGLGNYGSPSHNLPMDEFLDQYTNYDKEVISSGRYDKEDMRELIHDSDIRNDLKETFPSPSLSEFLQKY